jgi:hypothetical protein
MSLIVLSLSTHDNVGAQNFEYSLKKLGYEYHFLERGEKFKGFGWRTKVYIRAIQRLKKSDDDIFICVDSNDLFFVGSPSELLEKFKATGHRVLVGAEPACCVGKHQKDRITPAKAMIARIPDYRWRFPNGGTVMGYAEDLLKLFEVNKFEKDDQAGLTDLAMVGSDLFGIDARQEVFANIPAVYGPWRALGDKPIHRSREFDEYWKISEGRVVNKVTGSVPPVLHFSGKHWNVYNRVLRRFFPTVTAEGFPQNRIVEQMERTKQMRRGVITTTIWAAVIALAVIGGLSLAGYSIFMRKKKLSY